jgi:hypothetical protein
VKWSGSSHSRSALRRDDYIGRLIGVDQLDRWDVGTFGEFTDTARQLPFTALDETYLGHHGVRWGIPGSWGPQVVPPGYVRSW